MGKRKPKKHGNTTSSSKPIDAHADITVVSSDNLEQPSTSADATLIASVNPELSPTVTLIETHVTIGLPISHEQLQATTLAAENPVQISTETDTTKIAADVPEPPKTDALADTYQKQKAASWFSFFIQEDPERQVAINFINSVEQSIKQQPDIDTEMHKSIIAGAYIYVMADIEKPYTVARFSTNPKSSKLFSILSDKLEKLEITHDSIKSGALNQLQSYLNTDIEQKNINFGPKNPADVLAQISSLISTFAQASPSS